MDTCKILNKYEVLLLVWNYKQMKDSHMFFISKVEENPDIPYGL